MKMVKLTEDHYIVVDDSEITTGDIVAEKLLTGKYELFTIHTLNDIDRSSQKKITYSTQPESLGMGWMQSVLPLLLSEVKELLGEVDVEKKVMELYNNFKLKPFEAMYPLEGATKRFVENVYNQALEDNKEKKWTDADVVRIVEKSRQTGLTAEYLMLSLQPTEWEVEMVDGKLKLKS